ncbi:MAG: VOC family protein [Flavisolibacter sp.]|jgi:predicted enzyme related to lactoylglutathione lyase|nr:VOC family protein [Flavisolibacter sp.]
MRTHAINWFEIPVADFDRAKKFYEKIFDYIMPESVMGEARMGFFIYDFQNQGRGGAIVHQPGFHDPSLTGSLIYLNCEPDLQAVLDRVEAAGGKIEKWKDLVGENLGFWAVIHDTEGNRVALHSMK